MAVDGTSLPGSSYEELAKIIQAYLHAGDKSSPQDVAKRAAIRPEQVSRSSKFLIETGVLQQGESRSKSLTTTGTRLATALEHRQDDEIMHAWRDIALQSDFLGQILSAVRIRNGMDADSLRSHIAYASGKPKTPATTTGARTVASILQASGLLVDRDGKLVYAPPDDVPLRREHHGHDASGVEQRLPPRGSVPSSSMWASIADSIEHVNMPSTETPGILSIQVQVQCTPDDLDSLAPQLRKLLADLHAPPDGAAESDSD